MEPSSPRDELATPRSKLFMKNILNLLLCAAALLGAGCSTVPKSDLATLQGTWKGSIAQDNPGLACHFIVAGNNFEFRSDDQTVWYKGTFTLHENTTPPQYMALIRDCPFPQYVGKTSMAIYRVDKDSLTLTGNEPGKLEVPPAFDAPGFARMELKRQ
jgi:uncharacterized protein (TIGR03067 family)